MQPRSETAFAVIPLLLAALATPAAVGQDERPVPQAPVTRAGDPGTTPAVPPDADDREAAPVPGAESRPDGPSRRPVNGGKVTLGFKDVSVKDYIEWIAEMTGKVVIPVRLQTLQNQKITLINDEPLDRAVALDLVFSAFRLNDVGVIERDDVIIIGNLADVVRIGGDLPVLDAQSDVMGRLDRGTIVIKIFPVLKAPAGGIGEKISETFPDYATLTVDENSNQIVVLGDIGLCQQVQRLINELDETYINVKTETFHLQYSDANEIAANISELFEQTARPTSGRSTPRTTRRTNQPGRQPTVTTSASGPGPIVEMRITVNAQQNAITVQAEPDTIEQIRTLIDEHWDLPRPEGTAKVYALKYTDPIKMRDLLQEVLGGGGGGGVGIARGGRPGTAGSSAPTSVSQLVSGIYQIEAYPDQNSLLVLCKTEQNFSFLDSIIEEMDRPSSVGLPLIVELKHANAMSLAEELNVLLSEAGSQASLTRGTEGLTGEGMSDAGDGGVATRETGEAGQITFPWQRGRQRDDQAPETPLIGKIRIVPIIRQNAVAIVAPPHYQESVRDLIEDFDRPGRQVMISAIIAEVELNDDFAFGLRVAAGDLGLSNVDNALAGNVSGSATEDQFLGSLFDTSVLDLNLSANIAIQALDQKTNVRILQEPRVFTADNQEAIFFDGQDIPFITDSITTDTGGLNQSFEYRQVGVFLNVRPRITVQKDVDLEVNLELSSVVPGITLFGGAIIDRRQTNTQIIVKNGQTIVLSGILRDEESKVKRKVPILGDIPLLGPLAFTSYEDSTTTTELVAFITPTVVDNPSENDTNFNEAYRERLGDLTRPVDEQGDREDARERIRELIVPETAPQLEQMLDERDARDAAQPGALDDDPDVPLDIDDVNGGS